MIDSISYLLFVFKFILFLTALIAASLQDLRTRTVSDSIWVFLILSVFPVIITEIFVIGSFSLLDIFISASIMFLICSFSFALHIFGGADCKIFVLISAAFPFPFSAFVLASASVSIVNIYSFTAALFSGAGISVLMNSLLLSLIFMTILFFIQLFQNFRSFASDPLSFFIFLKNHLIQKIPFLVPITAGFVAYFLFGNLIFCFIRVLLL